VIKGHFVVYFLSQRFCKAYYIFLTEAKGL